MDPMWFFDEAGESEEWQALRKETLPLEKEHLDLRVALRDAGFALREDPENEDLKAQGKNLEERLIELEKKNPWISGDYPWEFFLWGVPHG